MSGVRAPFTVGIDGYNLGMAKGTGIATYARNLALCLGRMGHDIDLLFDLDVSPRTDEVLREILFFEKLGCVEPGKRLTRLGRLKRALIQPWARTAVEVPVRGQVSPEAHAERLPPYERLWTSPKIFDFSVRYFKLYGRFLTLNLPRPPTVMHWTYPLPIRVANAHNIYTIHDLVPLRMPQTTLDNKRFHYRLLELCLQSGDQICTVSESVRGDIAKMFPSADPNRVTNTYQAMGDGVSMESSRNIVERIFGLKVGGYFIYYGALEPKKNINRLLEAFLSAEITSPLVLVGGRSWMADTELKLLNSEVGVAAIASGRIRQMDYLPRPMLMNLVRGALAVVFPSLYEGFGLPALEAMTYGVPLLTSACGGLAELVGEAALVVDPYDTGAIRDGLVRLERDGTLRARLSRDGPVQARRFSMSAYEARLSTLYDLVLSRPRRRSPLSSSFARGAGYA